MMDHVAIRVKDLAASRRFYEAALGPLGYSVLSDYNVIFGMGQTKGQPTFWIGNPESGPLTSGAHIAFACNDRKTVDAFYKAAMGAGGRDNGAPGIRADYGENYYGAFVHDLDGNNIEAVCQKPA